MLVKSRKNLFLRNTKTRAVALELFILYCGPPRGSFGCHGQVAWGGGKVWMRYELPSQVETFLGPAGQARSGRGGGGSRGAIRPVA